MRPKRWSALALLVVIAMLGAACGDDEAGQGEKRTLKLVFMGDLTGSTSQLVLPGRDAAKLAVEELNAKGDLPVRLEMEEQDTRADKNKAATIAQGIKDRTDVLAVLGPAFSGESQTTGTVLDPAGIIRVTGSATNPPLAKNNWKYWFRALGNDSSQGGATDDAILKYLKKKSVFVGHDKTQYGEGLASIVRDAVKASGGTVSAFDAADPGKKDYSPLTTKVVAASPDVFFWGGYSPEAILIVKSLRDKGYKGIFMGADGSKDDSFLQKGAAAAEGAYLTCPCDDPTTSTDATVKKFVEAFKAKYNKDPGIYAGEYYDVVNLIADAVKRVGSYDGNIKKFRDAVRDAIRGTSYRGVTKQFSFQADGELNAQVIETYLYQVKSKKYIKLGKVSELAA